MRRAEAPSWWSDSTALEQEGLSSDAGSPTD